MTIEKLKKQMDEARAAWRKKVNLECKRLLVDYCGLCPGLGITRVIMGMGSWVIEGANVSYTYPDDPDDVSKMSLDDFVKYHLDPSTSDRQAIGVTDYKRSILAKIVELLDLWLDETGGMDVTL